MLRRRSECSAQRQVWRPATPAALDRPRRRARSPLACPEWLVSPSCGCFPGRLDVRLAVGAGRGRGHPEWDEVTRRHRGVAAHDDNASEEVLDRSCGLRADGTLPGDHAAQEPARPVDADEAGETGDSARTLAGGHGNFRDEFRAEWPFALGCRSALLADLVGDLVADLVPEPTGAGRRERLHLEGRSGVVEA